MCERCEALQGLRVSSPSRQRGHGHRRDSAGRVPVFRCGSGLFRDGIHGVLENVECRSACCHVRERIGDFALEATQPGARWIRAAVKVTCSRVHR